MVASGSMLSRRVANVYTRVSYSYTRVSYSYTCVSPITLAQEYATMLLKEGR